MAIISNNNIAEAIYLVSKESKDHKHFSTQVIQFLMKKKLLSKSADILSRLDEIINEAEGKVVARVYSVEKLAEKTKKELKDALEKRYGGKSVELEESLDNKLLGGYRVEVKDEVIDLTIKNKIGKLQAYLTHSV